MYSNNKNINNYSNSNSNSNYKRIYSIEPFDGIRKNNARTIFGILLIIVIIDFVIDIVS
jgi:hypothetical protein